MKSVFFIQDASGQPIPALPMDIVSAYAGRVIKQTKIGSLEVATCFTFVDRVQTEAEPALWETLVLGQRKPYYQTHTSRESALSHHEEVCARLAREVLA